MATGIHTFLANTAGPISKWFYRNVVRWPFIKFLQACLFVKTWLTEGMDAFHQWLFGNVIRRYLITQSSQLKWLFWVLRTCFTVDILNEICKHSDFILAGQNTYSNRNWKCVLTQYVVFLNDFRHDQMLIYLNSKSFKSPDF